MRLRPLHARTAGGPSRISICHCLDCKRRTGSAFSYNATFQADQVEVEGSFSPHSRRSDDGYGARHHFCPGYVAEFYEIERRPGMITLPIGTFAPRNAQRPASPSMKNDAVGGASPKLKASLEF